MRPILLCVLLLGTLLLARAQTNAPAEDVFSQVSSLSAANLRQRLQQESMAALVNANDVFYMTPLMFAASNNPDPEVVEVLLEFGAVLEARASNGLTALMFAARDNPNPEVARKLVQRGADINLRDFRGQNAVDYALQNPALGSRAALQGPLQEASTAMPANAEAVQPDTTTDTPAIDTDMDAATANIMPDTATNAPADASGIASDIENASSTAAADVIAELPDAAAAADTVSDVVMSDSDAPVSDAPMLDATVSDIVDLDSDIDVSDASIMPELLEAENLQESVQNVPALWPAARTSTPAIPLAITPAATPAMLPATSAQASWWRYEPSETLETHEALGEIPTRAAAPALLAWGACIDLNHASVDTLQQLAGVSIAQAEAIVAARRLLRFREVEALQLLEAIDTATLNTILEQGRACIR